MTRSNRLKVLLTAASVATLSVLLAALFAPVQHADAAFPGQNGKLVFRSYMNSGPGVDNPEEDYEIFTINPDGTGLVQLTHNSADDLYPAWSPDGESIAFTSTQTPNPDGSGSYHVYVMSADGMNQRRVTDPPGSNLEPSWSPSGTELVFVSTRHQTAENQINSEIYVVKVDGTDERRLTNNTASELMPEWSPSGEQIAYYSTLYSGVSTVGSDILVINSDGTNQRKVTDTEGFDYWPAWSPDGREIAFQNSFHNLKKIGADGTGLTNLTDPFDAWWDFIDSLTWAPDGKKIAFWGRRVLSYDNEADIFTYDIGIYLMNPDGSGLTKIPGTDVFSPAGLDWQPKSQEITPPSVTNTSPKANASEVAPAVNVRATFSEEMDSTTINGTTFKLFEKGTTTQIPAHVRYNADTDTAKLDPTNNLRRGVAYKAVVTTWATDVAGNRLDQDGSTNGFQQMRWFFRVDD
jgi:dipeptidyl aminopeptidase/acylaminoacyl peptidase